MVFYERNAKCKAEKGIECPHFEARWEHVMDLGRPKRALQGEAHTVVGAHLHKGICQRPAIVYSSKHFKILNASSLGKVSRQLVIITLFGRRPVRGTFRWPHPSESAARTCDPAPVCSSSSPGPVQEHREAGIILIRIRASLHRPGDLPFGEYLPVLNFSMDPSSRG